MALGTSWFTLCVFVILSMFVLTWVCVYRVLQTAWGSSRCWGSSSPSSCHVYTGSGGEDWLAEQSQHSRSGYEPLAPASHFPHLPHTDAECVVVDCMPHHWSMNRLQLGSPTAPPTPARALLHTGDGQLHHTIPGLHISVFTMVQEPGAIMVEISTVIHLRYMMLTQ